MKRHSDCLTRSESLGKEDKMNKHLRVLLVDNHELVRHELQRMLESEEDMQVVGDYASAEEAFPQLGRLSPDVILMDARLPGVNGIEATKHLKRNGLHCDADVILLAESNDHLVESLEAGAAGYLLKDITGEELVGIIREVYRNGHPPGEHDYLVEETIELVVPPSADAAKLLRFTNQVEKGLHANIRQTVGSWDWGTVITIMLTPDLSSNLLDTLGGMPDVERVEEEPLARDSSFSFLKKFRTLLRSRTSPEKRFLKRFLVTLKEFGPARQEFTAALN